MKYSKAAKRRAKKELGGGLPKLAETPRPKKRGKARMKEIHDEAQMDTLKARAHQVGSKDIDAMREQMLGEPAGQAIWLQARPDRRNALWDTYAALTAAETRYCKVALGRSLHAKIAKLEMLPEPMTTDADAPAPDLRSEDDRHRAAVTVWMRWQGYLGRLDRADHTAIMAVVRGRVDPVANGKATPAGKIFVVAMDKLAERVA